jgi:hypothetical protein
MITSAAIAEGLKNGATSRISKFSPDGKFIKSWGRLGHSSRRVPHAARSLAFDSKGRLWVADRGNHRLEIFDQDGKYLESRYSFSRPSGIFIKGDMLYVIDSRVGTAEPSELARRRARRARSTRTVLWDSSHLSTVRIRVYQGAAGEGVAVDADGKCTRPRDPTPSIRRAEPSRSTP